MELDYITIKLICSEILPLTHRAQIREIVAQGERGVALILWKGQESVFLVSAEPRNSRIHIISSKPSRSENPDSHFHRVLRHHLGSGTIDNISVKDGERVVFIEVLRHEFDGEIKNYRLIAELMGRYSNLILTDDSGMILACDHSYRSSDSDKRVMRPGRTYSLPAMNQRIPLRAYSLDDFIKFFASASRDIPWGRLFLDNFIGANPGFVKFIAIDSKISDKLFVGELSDELIEKLHDSFVKAVKRIHDNHLFPPFDTLLSIDTSLEYPINSAVEKFFAESITDEKREKRETVWRKTVEMRVKTLEKLIENLKRDQARGDESEKYRKLGDLIFANPHLFEKGTREAEVDDIYSTEPDTKIKIRLIPGKNAIETAQEYHRRAKRMSRGEKEILERIADAERNLEQYQDIIEPPDDILDLSDERFEKALEDIKGGKVRKLARKKTDEKKSELPRALKGINIHHYRSPEGHDIYVGGNDAANEALFKWGQPDDYWLHVKNMPGSHVLIPRRGIAIEFDTILFAAQLAVHHSSAKGSTKVPVDYTFLKFVNKPSGAPSGFVTYKKEKNILVDSPDEKKIEKRKVH